jgi:hypothetical protein
VSQCYPNQDSQYFYASACHNCPTQNGTGWSTNGGTSCGCATNYTFNPVSGRCELNCNADEYRLNNSCHKCPDSTQNGTGQPTNNGTSCECANNYTFNSTSGQCELTCSDGKYRFNNTCQVCPDSIHNGTGQSTNNGTSCGCTNNYTFNSALGQCELNCNPDEYRLNNSCHQCPDSIHNGTGQSTNNGASCGCAANYSFSPATGVCSPGSSKKTAVRRHI